MSASNQSTNTTLVFSNRTYDILKFITMIFLPALGSLYFGLSQIWGFPAGEEVVGTISLITVFFGSLLKVSNYQYVQSGVGTDGTLWIDRNDPTTDLYSLELDEDPVAIEKKNQISFNVKERDSQ